MRLIAPVWRSTPICGLEVIYNITPLDLHIEKLALATRWRTANIVKNNWVSEKKASSHIQTLDKKLKGLKIAPKSETKLHSVKERLFTIPRFDTTENNSLEANSVWYVYTDGSKIENKVGCAYILYKKGKEIGSNAYKLEEFNTVYQAEMMAINRASANLKHMTNAKIVFRVDCQSVLTTLASSTMVDELTKETIDNLNHIGRVNKVRLQWIRSHVGHKGNEAVDKLAKEAGVSGQEVPLAVPDSYIKSVFEKAI